MITQSALLAISLAYVGILFAIAHFGDLRAKRQPATRSALIYSLALGIYCTSWTFYGAVGRAASSGWDFLPIYLGPACVFLFGTRFLQRVVRISKENNITSVADFIGARYGRHQIVSSTVAIIAVLGTMPYIALQLKAVSFGFDAMIGGAASTPGGVHTAFIVAAVMAVFAILFGTRELSATENHHGMVLAVSFESLLKLAAFIAVGVYAVYLLYGSTSPPSWQPVFERSGGAGGPLLGFVTQTLLAAFAIVCLPRQFHIAVVENSSPAELRLARFAFPLYLLLISLFVIPIAEAGRMRFAGDALSPDKFVLALPLLERPMLALAAYLGGLSAATGMVIVEAIALATIVSNELVIPVLVRSKRVRDAGNLGIPRIVKLTRRWAVVGIMALAYLYYALFTGRGTLAEIGLLAFAAVAQFAPSFLGGIVWRRGSYVGAAAGLIVGALAWAYTLFLPAAAASIHWAPSLVERGPFGIEWLRPQSLWGSFAGDPLTHGVFWSLLANVVFYVGFSLVRKPGLRETLQAAKFLDAERGPVLDASHLPASRATIGDLRELAQRFLGNRRAAELVPDGTRESGALSLGDQVSPEIARAVEHALAGVIGASSARLVLSTTLRGRDMRPEDVVRLLDETSHAILFTRELLRSAIEHLPQGISVVDEQLRLVAWNQRYRTIFDYPAELMAIGRPIEDLIRYNAERGWLVTRDVEQSIRRRLEHMRAGRAYVHERVMPGGVVLEMRGNPLPGGGFVTSYSDVTTHKRAQAALQEGNQSLELRVSERTAELLSLNTELARSKLDLERAHLSKARFLAAAAHDLAQPITAARLFLSSIGPASPGAGRALVGKAESALGTAEQTLTSLLAYSRLDGGSEPVRIEHFELDSIVQPLLDEFGAAAAEKGLFLRAAKSHDVVVSDPFLLRRVLQNFLANAIRYTAHGGVVLRVGRRGRRVTVYVMDSGVGIPRSLHAEVFREYRQYVGPDRVARVGLGLGLAIAKRISTLLDHRIGLRSVVGKGSAFFIVVPAGERERVQTLPAAVAPTAASFAGKTVVCVEDEEAVLGGLETLLASWGCSTRGFQDGALAVDSATSGATPPNLLIVDYHLENRDKGLDVAYRLNAIWKKDIPIIVLTAADLQEHDLEGSRGVVRLIRKPIRPGALRALIDVVMG